MLSFATGQLAWFVNLCTGCQLDKCASLTFSLDTHPSTNPVRHCFIKFDGQVMMDDADTWKTILRVTIISLL